MTNEYNPDGKEIRFIDSHYKDLFHIPDGSCVQIHYPDEMVVKPCTFIDEYHNADRIQCVSYLPVCRNYGAQRRKLYAGA